MKNKQNVIFICIILAVCVVIAYFGLLRKSGATAIVQFGNGNSVELSLTNSGIHTLENGEIPIYLEILDQQIRFVNSKCPDHVCESFGWLSKEEDTAICAPARAAISIQP